MEMERWSGEAHDPEVGSSVNLTDGGFEVIDWCVHDVGGGMVVRLECPTWANRAASLFALLE